MVAITGSEILAVKPGEWLLGTRLSSPAKAGDPVH
jgi:hypothetical protein